MVVERLHIDEPEPTPPEPAPSAERPDHQENTEQPRRTGQNFRITDDHLGEGGPRLKYQTNITAIRLLKELEAAGQQASPEQQEVLSRYVLGRRAGGFRSVQNRLGQGVCRAEGAFDPGGI